jgi:hypothetical protein
MLTETFLKKHALEEYILCVRRFVPNRYALIFGAELWLD